MKKILIFVFLVSILGSGCEKVFNHGDGVPPVVKANSTLITDWISLHFRIIRDTKGVQHIVYSRHFAYIGIALYQSIVPSFHQYGSLEGQLNGLGQVPAAPHGKKLHPEASANAAIAQMMRFFYGTNPAHVSLIDSLENVKQQSIDLGPHTPWHAESADYGKQVANAISTWSATDGSDQANAPYTPPVGDGLWKATPPAFSAASLPYWKNNRPIVANSQQDVTLPAPVTFSTDPQSPFYAMVNQVYKTSQQQSSEQKAIALFWDDAPNGKYLSAFGHWISVLAQVAKEKNLSLIETAEAYTKTAIAMHEAIIATWKLKYTYNLVRPVTYIQQHLDNKWLPIIGTPPHPEYPAAHATLSTAAAFALTNALGSNVSFTDHSYDDIGMSPRSYPNFEAAGAEAGLSRLYGGIHYQPSIDAGATVGKQVAKNMINSLKFRK